MSAKRKAREVMTKETEMRAQQEQWRIMKEIQAIPVHPVLLVSACLHVAVRKMMLLGMDVDSQLECMATTLTSEMESLANYVEQQKKVTKVQPPPFTHCPLSKEPPEA